MRPKKKTPRQQNVGDVLRTRRVEVLKKSLREMARFLGIAPAHLTHIEQGRKAPSEDLLLKIGRAYGIAEAELRSGWSRPETIVGEIASQDSLAAEKVPELLRSARRLSSNQWDSLIEEARRMSGRKDSESDR